MRGDTKPKKAYRVALKKVIDLSVYVQAEDEDDAGRIAWVRVNNEDETVFYDEVQYTRAKAYVLVQED